MYLTLYVGQNFVLNSSTPSPNVSPSILDNPALDNRQPVLLGSIFNKIIFHTLLHVNVLFIRMFVVVMSTLYLVHYICINLPLQNLLKNNKSTKIFLAIIFVYPFAKV